VRRGELNRQAIVDAALSLASEEGTIPTAQAIADRAGVAKRSLFHHFSDMEALFAHAADSQAAKHWTILEPPDPSRPLEERLRDAVSQRALLFEAIGDVRRVAAQAESTSPTLAGRMAGSRRDLDRHIRLALGPELRSLDRPAVEGLCTIASWEAWDLLRRDRRLSVPAARAAVESTIRSAVERALTREG
jgi:TetR/AcrR family transcriptional regulator, regulator of autoinduction and epiphytic fitness